jgi:hypothetical protein
MPGAFIPHKGTNVPPTTQWFGTLPDRLNFLTPNDISQVTAPGSNSAGNFTWIKPLSGVFVSADYGNLWSPWVGCSFGATTTAPDGTTVNSQLLQEDSSNGFHVATCTLGSAGLGALGGQACGALRLSGYFKFAGRRVVLRVFSGGDVSGSGYKGCYAVFDLQGGQVGVGPTFIFLFGGRTGVVPLDAQIVAYPNGWYRCSLDFSVTRVVDNNLTSQIMLDNGTGTAALSNSYVGNPSGVGAYVWRTNLMPIGAYALNNPTFFDDMTRLSNFDLNNTLAPGFDWYMGGNNPDNFGWTETVTQPASFAQSGSVVSFLKTTSSPNGVTVQSAARTGPGTWIGKTWKPPFLIEVNGAFRFDLHAPNTVIGMLWCITQDAMSQSGLTPTTLVTPDYLNWPTEIDFMEINYPVQNMRYHGNIGPPINLPNRGASTGGLGANAAFCRGTPPWEALWNYAPTTGVGVMQGGLGYVGSFPTFGVAPPGSTWTLSPYPPGGGTPAGGPRTVFDYAQFHTYSFLFLPYFGQTDLPNTPPFVSAGNTNPNPNNEIPDGANPRAALQCAFIDGLMVGWGGTYTPFTGNGASSLALRVEGNSYPIWIGADQSPGCTIQIDWIRVTQ